MKPRANSFAKLCAYTGTRLIVRERGGECHLLLPPPPQETEESVPPREPRGPQRRRLRRRERRPPVVLRAGLGVSAVAPPKQLREEEGAPQVQRAAGARDQGVRRLGRGLGGGGGGRQGRRVRHRRHQDGQEVQGQGLTDSLDGLTDCVTAAGWLIVRLGESWRY